MFIIDKKMQPFTMYILGVIFCVMAIVIFIFGFIDYDKSRIKASVFVECEVLKNIKKCESFLDPDKMMPIIDPNDMMPIMDNSVSTSIPFDGRLRSFLNTRIGTIYELIIHYEMLIRGKDTGNKAVTMDLIVKYNKYFDIKDDRIEYKWYFKSIFGTLYRMVCFDRPVIFEPKFKMYDAIIVTLISFAVSLFIFGIARSQG